MHYAGAMRASVTLILFLVSLLAGTPVVAEPAWEFKMKGEYYGPSRARISKYGLRLDETFIGAIVPAPGKRIICFNNQKKTYFEDDIKAWAANHAPGCLYNEVEVMDMGDSIANTNCSRLYLIKKQGRYKFIIGVVLTTKEIAFPRFIEDSICLMLGAPLGYGAPMRCVEFKRPIIIPPKHPPLPDLVEHAHPKIKLGAEVASKQRTNVTASIYTVPKTFVKCATAGVWAISQNGTLKKEDIEGLFMGPEK